MLRHAGDPTQIDLGSERKDDVLELNNDSGREIAGVDANFLFLKIHMFHAAAVYCNAATEAPDRIDHVARSEGGSCHLGQHGLKNHVVLFRDDSSFIRRDSG